MSHPLLAAVAAAQHDLGKYACLTQRFLPPGAPDAELLDALQTDLLSTRSGPGGTQDVAEVWHRLAPGLAPLRPDPDLDELDAALGAIAPALGALRAGALDRPALEALAAQARRIPAALKRLHTRLKGA